MRIRISSGIPGINVRTTRKGVKLSNPKYALPLSVITRQLGKNR